LISGVYPNFLTVEQELDNISLESTSIVTPEVAEVEFERVASIRSSRSTKAESVKEKIAGLTFRWIIQSNN